MSRREATDVNTEPQTLRSQLVATAAGYRHVHEEHRRARRSGHTRRHLKARLEELSTHLERLLTDPALDETVRMEWRRHAYHGDAEPDWPTEVPAPRSTSRRPPRNKGRGSAPLWQR
jgi:hypothetical protein